MHLVKPDLEQICFFYGERLYIQCYTHMRMPQSRKWLLVAPWPKTEVKRPCLKTPDWWCLTEASDSFSSHAEVIFCQSQNDDWMTSQFETCFYISGKFSFWLQLFGDCLRQGQSIRFSNDVWCVRDIWLLNPKDLIEVPFNLQYISSQASRVARKIC